MIFSDLIQFASNLPTSVSALESSISALERAISALESDIATLDSSSLPFEHKLPWFTGAVVVGVLMELWVIWHEYSDDLEAWALTFFGLLRPPARPWAFKVAVEVASVVLITFGIVGELWIGIRVASINGVLRGKSAELRSKNAELRSKSDQLLAFVTQEAGTAKTSAKRAALGASKANDKANEAEGAANRASTSASDALRDERQLAEIQKFLLAKSLPRQLNNELLALLKKLPPAKADILYKDEPNGEPFWVATSIREALVRAGWDVPQIALAPVESGKSFPVSGVQIFNNRASFFSSLPDVDMSLAGLRQQGVNGDEALKLALLVAGTDAGGATKDLTLPDNSFRIVVNARGPLK